MNTRLIYLVIAGGCYSAAAQDTTHSQHQHQAPQPSGPDATNSQMKQRQGMANMPGMNHAGMGHNLSASEMFLMNESSGTAFQPSSWPMPMVMTRTDDWHLMWMGQAFIVDTQQAGPRGGDKFYSTNWGMLGAVHDLAGGSIMLRSMLSLEPATITDRRYPLLFQTGETAYGVPLVDAQHPHDFVMELSAQYARPLGEKGTWDLYFAPVGDPALGPVPYPHRASAVELPQAPLGHHWEDSTHIANNVLTVGVTYGKIRLDASGFYGREPDEARWNIDWGAMNSWSARLSVFPTKNWAAQVSVGRLHDAESHTPGDVVRTTASLEYIRPEPGKNAWATSLIWGQNYKTVEHRRTNAVLAETVVPLRRRNFVTGRFEWSERDELFDNNPDLAEQLTHLTGQYSFNVSAVTGGYTRDVPLFRNVQTGIGANATAYVIESALTPYYGEHPWGMDVFIRVRLKPGD
jgi:hypothetical protein